MTRRLYARIRAVTTGLRRPSPDQDRIDPIQYILLLEPLYLGVLPASIVPILLFLVPVVLLAAFAVAPRVNRSIERVAAEARAERTGRSQKEE